MRSATALRMASRFSKLLFLASSSSAGLSTNSWISLIVHLKTASLPASSGAPYSAGKVTFTSTVLPTSAPINWSSKPGMNEPEPSSSV